MAAIAKFISYDGGIAFSDTVLKFQKRDAEAKLIPIGDVESIGVRRPQQDTDGFIRIQLADGKRYRLFFGQDQLRDAVAFKKQFEASCPPPAEEPAQDAAPAPEPEPEVPEEEPAPQRLRRPVRQDRINAEEQWDASYPEPEPRRHDVVNIMLTALIVVLVLIGLTLGGLIYKRVQSNASSGNPGAGQVPPSADSEVMPARLDAALSAIADI